MVLELGVGKLRSGWLMGRTWKLESAGFSNRGSQSYPAWCGKAGRKVTEGLRVNTAAGTGWKALGRSMKASLWQQGSPGASTPPHHSLPGQDRRGHRLRREYTRQRLMPFKQTQSEKDRESQYLSEQAKQAGSPRNVRAGGRPAPREHYFNRQIFGNRHCPGMGGGGSSSSPPFCPEMDGTRPGNKGAGRWVHPVMAHHFP